MQKEHKGDSYIVDILPPASGAPYPIAVVGRRKHIRQSGKVEIEHNFGFTGKQSDFENEESLNALAQKIGRIILDDSEIVKEYMQHKRQLLRI